MTTWMHYRVSTGTGKSRLALLTRAALLMGLGLTMLLTACSAIAPDAPAQNPSPTSEVVATATPRPRPTASPTQPPATLEPSPTATPPLSWTVMQALRDSFNCLTNNLNFSPGTRLTDFCPGYWGNTTPITHNFDAVLIRTKLEPALTPLDNLRWRLDEVTDVVKDEAHSTRTNPVYRLTLSSTLSGDVTLTCPSGTPAPVQTTVNIPISGQALIYVYDYQNEPRATMRIESWAIEGDPVVDYCAKLP
jgi:hypothetical protein